MDKIQFNLDSSGIFHIEGFSNSVAVLSPTDNIRQNTELRHLALHHHDLTDAKQILQLINETENISIKLFLFESAVVKVIKCFQHSESRSPLKKKFLAKKQGASNVLKYFESMRNKTIVHDENGYNHCDIGLVINDGTKPYSIEKIVTPSFTAIALNQENYANLNQIIEDSLEWIKENYDKLASVITDHYEKLGRETLLKYPPMRSDLKISAEDMHLPRPSK